jgi:release factor glutamine methyltransferase
MNWQEYIDHHYTDILPVYERDEAVCLLRKIAEHICNASYSIIKNTEVSAEHVAAANIVLEELKKGRPLQYIKGETWFYKYPFKVNESVLIPRPETEELVEWILNYIGSLPTKNTSLKILDVGTGSGCIPITLKKEIPELQITSIDISTDALVTAKENAVSLQTEIEFRTLDFLNEASWNDLKMYDIIISNPPYIPLNEKETLSVNVRNHEPHQALFVPENQPLLFYEKIARFGKDHLNDHGMIFLELHQDHASETKKLYEEFGYKNVELRKDISGNDRMLKGGK